MANPEKIFIREVVKEVFFRVFFRAFFLTLFFIVFLFTMEARYINIDGVVESPIYCVL